MLPGPVLSLSPCPTYQPWQSPVLLLSSCHSAVRDQPWLLHPYLLLAHLRTHPNPPPISFQEAEDEKSVLMAAVQSGGEEASLLLPELGSAFYDVAR